MFLPRCLAVVICLSSLITLRAQLDLLSPNEAKALVELLPEVRAAKERGECPSLSVTYVSPRELAIQARGACPPVGYSGSMLIDNYLVDRRTGTVRKENSDVPSDSPEVQAEAKVLLERASKRPLSAREGECLARTAAFASYEQKGAISGEQIGRPFGHTIRYLFRDRLTDEQTVIAEWLSVDLASARVRNDNTGMDVASSKLCLIASKMLAVRAPALLSAQDVARIAREVPAIAERISNGCSELVIDGDGTALETYVGLRSWCAGASKSIGVLVSVNRRTGIVTDPRRNRIIDSRSAIQTARQLINHLEDRRLKLRTELQDFCRATH
jgi:hypothetical protein